MVRSHPNSNPFHCAAWAQVIAASYGHEPRYLCIVQNGEPLGVIPLIEIVSRLTGRRGVCLPFSDACGPLVFGRNGSKLVHQEVSQLAATRRWDYYEIRGGEAVENETSATTFSYYGHQLSLSGDSTEVFSRFRSSTRTAIRQGERENLEVEIADTVEAVREFYRLHAQTRRRHGSPPQPLRFFLEIQRHMLKTGRGFIVLVRMGRRAMAGALFLVFGRRAVYKYAASSPKFSHYRGNNLVIWTAIQRLIQQGIEVLDFGRTGPNNSGLRRFKLGWGAHEDLLHYRRFDVKAARWQTASPEGANSSLAPLFRHLPLTLNRIAGALAYPHLQ